MKCLHTVASIKRTSGGPSHSVTNLCSSLGRKSQQVHLLVIGEQPDAEQWVLPDLEVVILHNTPGIKLPLLGMSYAPEFGFCIQKINETKKLNLIHDHGLWLPNNRTTSVMACELNIPLVVSPRGMLEPWALKYKGWKKKFFWLAWQKSAIEKAALLHATANNEADNLRALGLKNPIAIIPNGVDVPASVANHEPESERIVLFLSRVHPIKGINNLINAWEQLKPQGWKLVIAGPDEGGHLAEVQSQIAAAGLTTQVQCIGPVEGEAKWQLYQQASVFVLPTFSENFGIVIAEALAAGVPVITTTGTPWRELPEKGCGWWVDIGVQPLVGALREALGLTDEQRRDMGLKGREWMQAEYSWSKIATEMIAAYRWVLEGGSPPACVRLD